MQNQTVPNKQNGFTLVEVVAVMVIVVVLAASAIPRMGPGEFAARTAADRLLAALQYAQVLAQRQGVATSVVIAPGDPQIIVKYSLSGTVVPLGNETYSDYRIRLNSDVVLSAGTVTYGVNGIPTAGVGTYSISGNGMNFIIKVESTGFAHFG